VSGQIGPEVLRLDPAQATEEICGFIRDTVYGLLRKKGAVVGISGGIDSSVVTALCARALGPTRVVGLLMPERHSSPETLALSRSVAESQGVEQVVLEEITPPLEALRCYERQDDSIRTVISDYGPGWRSKITLPGVVEDDRARIYSVVALSPDGTEIKRRLPPNGYLGIVAATNFKQRVRTMLEYYHADARNFAVAGTPNLLEYDQGFFVKGGDGLADFKPIAHLYKTQVYQLAEFLGVPADVRNRPPTTDTYSLPQGQDEFYFSLPYDRMDLCLYAKNNGHPASALTKALGLAEEQIERVYKDIDSKRRTASYLHRGAVTFEARMPAASKPH
jgi:NAD+ synthase